MFRQLPVRPLFVLLLAVSLPVGTSAAATTTGNHAPPSVTPTAVVLQDTVVGSAITPLPPEYAISPGIRAWNSYRVDTRSGPSGESPSGTVSINFCVNCQTCCTSVVSGDLNVTCLEITGNRAVIGYYSTGNRYNSGEALPGVMVVVDNGRPGLDGQMVDQIGFRTDMTYVYLPGNAPPITDCSPAVAEGIVPTVLPGTQGDFTVTDASARPTTRDQCKGNGWRAYGYKNQGQCVSSVKPARDR